RALRQEERLAFFCFRVLLPRCPQDLGAKADWRSRGKTPQPLNEKKLGRQHFFRPRGHEFRRSEGPRGHIRSSNCCRGDRSFCHRRKEEGRKRVGDRWKGEWASPDRERDRAVRGQPKDCRENFYCRRQRRSIFRQRTIVRSRESPLQSN